MSSLTSEEVENWQGPVDLGNCDREPIHLLGGIQDFGFLLAASSDWIIQHASANAERWLGRAAADILGLPLTDLVDGEALHAIRNRLQGLSGPDSVERIFGIDLLGDGRSFDAAVHISGRSVILECEPRDRAEDDTEFWRVQTVLSRLRNSRSVPAFLRDATRLVQSITGFDRVMVYRFDEDGSGEVVSEALRGAQERYLGLRYPASDIPKQARALYRRNWLRSIADVASEPVPVVPPRNPEGAPLDLSMSMLRSVSPIHLEYLRNMGVGASLSVSIIQGGELWGLIACHHYAPHCLSFRRRAALELFGETFSLLLEARLRDEQAERERDARAVHDRLMRNLALGGEGLTNSDALASIAQEIEGLVPADGIGIWIDGECSLQGAAPEPDQFADLVRFLNRAANSQIYAVRDIAAVHPPARAFAEDAVGLLAIPISRTPRDYLVLFRREVIHTVTWGGKPDKTLASGPNGPRLTPRKSFEAWRETVQGQSQPWTPAERSLAEGLRITLLEVMLRLTDRVERGRRTAQERQEVVIAELNHRVRNLLSLIRGLVRQSAERAGDLHAFVDILDNRIQALARAQDLITDRNWKAAPLRSLITAEAAAYLGQKADRVKVDGPPVLLQPEAFSTLALVVHELTTNSAKYGALCDTSGRVEVAWHGGDSRPLVVEWREFDGPKVQPPERRGFGSMIVERAIPHQLSGAAKLDFHPDGLRASLTLPEQYVAMGSSDDETGAAERLARRDESPSVARMRRMIADGLWQRVLIVEDNMMVAMDIESFFQSLGIRHVDMAGSVSEGLRLIGANRPDVAVLDANLGTESSFAVADRLGALGVPFFFATGYGETDDFPVAHRDRPRVAKPYDQTTLWGALEALLGSSAARPEA